MNKEILPNPYTRAPIKARSELAGRNKELKTINYYLKLTASGQSPHLALIGQRGVGKTSLLFGAESYAKELKLLPVRIDMNQEKARYSGSFWQNFYCSLILNLAKAGCWGGMQGRIYTALFTMVNGRQLAPVEDAVLQFPFALACHKGTLDTFECPDPLIVHDFETCINELRDKGYAGIAIIIDEADCLGQNVPLLQMFRNIFQVVERCSLILAGTEAVFPALSEIFSPIPRQFHRIDVKPFASWSDTRQLVTAPLIRGKVAELTPSQSVIRELHELCGGDPAEIQLYCHHMYKRVEQGASGPLSLLPEVFRQVLGEYRSNSPADAEAVLNSIENLPELLLCQSPWLARRELTLSENIKVQHVRSALKKKRALETGEFEKISTEITNGYAKLFSEGIIEVPDRIKIKGAPFTSGFWKSFVEVEKKKRWKWNDESFVENLSFAVISRIVADLDFDAPFVDVYFGDAAVEALMVLRDGKRPDSIDESMTEMIVTSLVARECNAKVAIDIVMQIDGPSIQQTFQTRFLESQEAELCQEHFEKLIREYNAILASFGFTFQLRKFKRWILPNSEELHRLGRISDYPVPDVFAPSDADIAVAKFREGDTPGAAAIFARMISDRDTDHARNNLAFCQLVLGDFKSALENAEKAIALDYEPLYEMNKGLAEYLNDRIDLASKAFLNALNWINQRRDDLDLLSALYVLILNKETKGVLPVENIPLDAAIIINRWRIGDLSQLEAAQQLKIYHGDQAERILDAAERKG